ncbi:MAG: hemolysin family protein [Lachnospiraceae bacterium]|nr:hemolysin family protein [Lachnospiraceae bacterium]
MTDGESAIQLLILFLLLLLSAFFSSAETALTTVSEIKMRTMAEEGSRRAKKVLKCTEQKNKMLSAILIGNNIVNLSASSLATTVAVRVWGSYGAGIATGILTFLVLIFGEISPKTMAAQKAGAISLRYAGVILFIMHVLTPVIFIVNAISGLFLRMVGVDPDAKTEGLTEQEIRTIVDVSHETGVIEQEEKKYIHNIFDFSDATAKEIMIPRIDMVMVDVNWSYEKIIEVFQEEMLTRMPVYEGDTDHIIGLINMKDLLVPESKETFSVRNYTREVYFTYEQKNAAELFEEMRQDSRHSMAIVLDEYGAVSGLVTLEDLLEELVGEIRDEYDENEEDSIVATDDAGMEYDVLGSVNLEDLCDELPVGFESEDYDTLGGFLVGEFDHFPKAGETYVSSEGVIVRVVAIGRRRIEKVHIRFPMPVDEFKEHLKEMQEEE